MENATSHLDRARKQNVDLDALTRQVDVALAASNVTREQHADFRVAWDENMRLLRHLSQAMESSDEVRQGAYEAFARTSCLPSSLENILLKMRAAGASVVEQTSASEAAAREKRAVLSRLDEQIKDMCDAEDGLSAAIPLEKEQLAALEASLVVADFEFQAQEVAEMQKRKARATEWASELGVDVQGAIGAAEALHRELAAAREANARRWAKLSHMETQMEAEPAIVSEISALQADQAHVRDELQNLRSRSDEYRSQVERLQPELKTIEDQLRAFPQTKKAVDAECATLQKAEGEALKAEETLREETATFNSETLQLEAQLASIRKELTGLNATNEKKELQRLRGALDTATQRRDSLRADILAHEQAKDRTATTMQVRLQEATQRRHETEDHRQQAYASFQREQDSCDAKTMILEEKKRELQSMMLVVDRSQADVAALTGQLEEYVRIETEKTEVDAKLMSNQSHEVQQLIEDEKAIHNENIKRMNQDFEKEKATRASKPRRPKRRFGGIRGTPEVGVRDRIKNALSRVMTPHKTPTTPKTPSSDRAARVRILNNSGRSLLEPSKLKRRSMRHPSKSQGADLFDEGLDSLA